MNLFLTILAFLVIFSILILIHEAGHFFAAKRAGIRVDEFGFGLPPKIWGKKIGETLYSINVFPFGGFVRLYGEDAHDPEVLKSKKSFAGKSLRQRIWVVIAGVFMNFILAILLLTFGFTFGIQPLLANHQDVLQAIDKGQLQIRSGMVVKEVMKDSVAEKTGFLAGDTVVQMNGNSVLDFGLLQSSLKKPPQNGVSVRVLRGPTFLDFKILPHEQEEFGVQFYDVFFMPRLVLSRPSTDSAFGLSGLQEGDVLLKINDKNVYSVPDYQAALQNAKELNLLILRNYREMTFHIPFDHASVIIAEVLAGSPAEKAFLQKGDRIVKVDRWDVEKPEDVTNVLRDIQSEQPVPFLISRGDALLTFYLMPDDEGHVGILLSSLVQKASQTDTYFASVPTSVLKIEDVQYPFFQAFTQAVRETYRLGVATISMFGDLLSNIASDFNVPEGVSGPVGIAQMTGVFVREGFLSLVRFTALLSLSLAVMNLLPFPGLDGGRLLFLVVEGIRGRRVPARLEHAIHTLGFVLLLLIILAVTYKDIVRIFVG